MNKARYISYIFLGLLIVLLWYFRTWFQGIALFFYATPVIWQVIALTVLLHYGVFRRSKALTHRHKTVVDKDKQVKGFSWIMIVTPFVFFVLLTTGLIMSNLARGVHLAQTLSYHSIDALPESTADLRLMPYQVAERYAKDSLQLSQYQLGTENIALVNNRLTWTFPLTPDGLAIKFLRQNKGIVTIDATTQAKNASHTWIDMTIGEGMQIRDNLYWNLYRDHFFVTLDDPFYLPKEDEIYTVVAATDYSFRFRWGIFYTVPRFKGVFVVNTKGDIELVEPENAPAHPVLAGNRIFPEDLARRFVAAYEYRLGVINKLFIHEDQIKIQDVQNPGSSVNKQPYLMNSNDGLKWFISAEPYGASHGIFKIFIVDAATGRIEVFNMPTQDTLTGPVRAVDYVRRSNPVVDWSRFDSVEPLPFVRDNILYWKLTVIPGDAAGIAYQVFVNAATNDVYEMATEGEVKAFLQGSTTAESLEKGPRDLEGEQGVLEDIRQKLREIDELLEQIG